MNLDSITYFDAGATTGKMIEKETEIMLRKKGLWKNSEAWTEATMYELARCSPEYSFEQMMLSVKKIAPSRMVSLMNTYALAVQDKEHIQDAFEYAVQLKQIYLLDQLLLRCKGEHAFKEWVLTYQLLSQILQGKLVGQKIGQCLSHLLERINDPILKIRLLFIGVLDHFYKGDIEKVLLFSEKIPHLFIQVKQGFIKNTLMHRVSIIMAMRSLYEKGDVKKVERDLLTLIKEGAPDIVLALCYHVLGQATLFKDDDRCLKYLKKAVAYADNKGFSCYRKRLHTQHIPFARNVRGEVFDVSGAVPEEKVHQYIVRGEYVTAQKLVNELKYAGYDSPFLKLYQARAAQDIEGILHAYWRLVSANHAYLFLFVRREVLFLQKERENELVRLKSEYHEVALWKKILSPRRKEVLEKIYQGYTQTQIAAELYVELSTVKKHVNYILKETGVKTSKEAALIAKRLNMF